MHVDTRMCACGRENWQHWDGSPDGACTEFTEVERPDAAPPKEVLHGIAEAARNEGRYLNDDELEVMPNAAESNTGLSNPDVNGAPSEPPKEVCPEVDAPEGPREVLNVARLYISALESAVQDYRENPTSNHLDMIHDIVRNTGEDFRDALNRLDAQR